MTVAFKTFGCRLNRAEALDLEARYRAGGYEVVNLSAVESTRSARSADPTVIVVRGCSVTAKAQRDCEKEIARLRARFPTSDIRITGCLPQTQPTGTAPPLAGTVPMATSRAYLKVQDGCSGRCAFCIVPQFRGPPVSVPLEAVLSRARAFLDAGYHEIVVTGCNLALYRSSGRGLPDLLSALAKLSPAHRIRLGSLEPGICDDALLDAFASHPNICRFIHLSLQSGSDAVLRRMTRPYTIEAVARFCSSAFARLGPHLALGADVIAGFPGETDEDHQLTRSFLKRNWHPASRQHEIPPAPHPSPRPSNLSNLSNPSTFSLLHVFPYSERPGTPAASMDGALPRVLRIRRAHELEKLVRRQRLTFAKSFLGQRVEVCVERGGDHGWTAEYLPCRFTPSAPRRSLVSVLVQGVEVNGQGSLQSLLGTVCT